MGKGTFTASEVGERIRLVREDRNLSQGGLASLCAPGPRGPRSATWISNFETGAQDPAPAELAEIAKHLQVDPVWLLVGDRNESEFIARMRGMEGLMDERGRRSVLAVAEREVEEAERQKKAGDAFDVITRQMQDAGLDPDTIAQVVRQARETLRESESEEREQTA